MASLLEVRQLSKYYKTPAGILHAVDQVSFEAGQGTTFAIVGESGCGKTTLGRCILRLIEPSGGEILYRGENILRSSKRRMKQLRRDIQMVFQNPFSSLDPRCTVEQTLREVLTVNHMVSGQKEIDRRLGKLMGMIRLDDRLLHAYPHEMDGGQCQRVGIARALAVEPGLLVCDEPVSSLDVSAQAQILNLLKDLQSELALTYLLISHNLAVIRHMADEIIVMYMGQIVEKASNDELFAQPLHPYTQGLLAAVPDPWQTDVTDTDTVLLSGEVSAAVDPKDECRFASRCPFASALCRQHAPSLQEVETGHYAACCRYM